MQKQFKIKWILFFWILFGNGSKASDVFWITINTVHSYEDVSTMCKFSGPLGGKFYFAAEHRDGKLERVILSNFPYKFPYEPIYQAISLSDEQIKKISLYKDSKGRYWLKNFIVEEAVLKWILFRSAERSSFCPLPQQLKNILPAPVPYEFEVEGLEEGIWISYSNTISFDGARLDGNSFKAKLKMIQREYKP